MRRFRVFLFLLLSLVIPLQGYALVALPELYCPMERTAMTDAGAETAHDGCPDAESAAEPGKLCKSGQPCQSAGPFFPVSGLDALPLNPISTVRFPHFSDVSFSFDPAAAWRPPAQL